MFGLKDKVAGIIGGVMAFGLIGLFVALTITRGTLATRTAELATVKAARAADQSEWRRATAEAQAKDAEHARQVEQQQRSEEHTSELQSLMRISYAVF